MNSKYKVIALILLATCFVAVLAFLVSGHNSTLFNSKGNIAVQERNLIFTAALIMLVVVVPVFVAFIYIAWKYRASNSAEYIPNGIHNPLYDLLWWAIPSLVVLVLAPIMWSNTHSLDPRKTIESANKPITIQVVALQWKWLFIYPEQNIATVNFVQFPEQTPIIFELTADAPMNSFWIPELGGQMYAMAGMKTHLNLIADQTGDFAGSAAEISGVGFAGMKFTARASSQSDFDAWVNTIRLAIPNSLNTGKYSKLAEASADYPVEYYTSAEGNLFEKIRMKFMSPYGGTH